MNAALINYDYKIGFLENSQFASLRMTVLEVAVTLFSAYFVFVYLKTKFWVANNMLSIAFCIHAIENWLIGNFRHVVLVFGGLIAYDVYFVFNTEVMMAVA